MAARSEAAPLSDKFRLDDVVSGLAGDLADLRAGKISVEDARVRAEVAKQVLNGVRLVISAQRYLEEHLKLVGPTEK